jgi:cytoskeletal protein CcmA (bactofilin family)
MFGKSKRRSAVIQTLVGEGTRIEGDLRFEGGCHIDGLVHGSVVADRDPEAFLSVSEDGRIEGSVKVPQMSLNGTVEGDVYCTERVQLGPTARVVGNLHYELIEMAAGAEVNGQLIHQTGKTSTARKPQSDVDSTQPLAAPVIAESEG